MIDQRRGTEPVERTVFDQVVGHCPIEDRACVSYVQVHGDGAGLHLSCVRMHQVARSQGRLEGASVMTHDFIQPAMFPEKRLQVSTGLAV